MTHHDRKVIVAPSIEQARIACEAEGINPKSAVIVTTDRAHSFPMGLYPLAADVIHVAGWERGAHADHVRRSLARALAKRLPVAAAAA